MERPAYTGLEYASIPVVMTMLGVRNKDRARLFADLRIMELAALAIHNAPPDTDG